MQENCKESCPVIGKVESLEKEFDRFRNGASATHKEIYKRVESLEQTYSRVDEKLDGITEKLDSATDMVNKLAQKPAKRWESVVDKVLMLLVGAVIAFLLAKLGL